MYIKVLFIFFFHLQIHRLAYSMNKANDGAGGVDVGGWPPTPVPPCAAMVFVSPSVMPGWE